MSKTVTVEFHPNDDPPFRKIPDVTIYDDDPSITWVLHAPRDYIFSPQDGIQWRPGTGTPIIGDPVRSDDYTWVLHVKKHGDLKGNFYYWINVVDQHGRSNRYKDFFRDDPEVTNDPTGGGGSGGRPTTHPHPEPHET